MPDDINLEPQGQFSNLGGITFPELLRAALTMLLVIAAIVFIVSLIIGGIRWILSGGDKARSESARAQIVNALIGIIIVFAAWAIIQLISSFFGIDLLHLEIPTLNNPGGV
jgi:uncharacterized membrane protein (UPF0182 family)